MLHRKDPQECKSAGWKLPRDQLETKLHRKGTGVRWRMLMVSRARCDCGGFLLVVWAGILQRVEEAQDLAFLLVGERVVTARHARGLSLVALDSFLFGERQAIMHQPVSRAERPKRCSADLIRRGGKFRQWQEWNAVAGADIVQEKITIGMN